MRYLSYVEFMTDGVLRDTLQAAVDSVPREVIGTSEVHVYDTLEQGVDKWYEVVNCDSISGVEAKAIAQKPDLITQTQAYS